MTSLSRISRRTYRRHPWQTLLSILGIALGVAIVLAIDLTTTSAERAFVLATESIGGQTTHEVVGGADGIDERHYTDLRTRLRIRSCAPIVEGDVRVLRDNGDREPCTLLGVDPFAEAPLRAYFAFGTAESESELDLGPFLTAPGACATTERLADSLGWKLGDQVEVEAQGVRSRLELVSLLTPRDPVAARGLDRVIVADIATAQECLDRIGRIDRIDLALGPDADELRKVLPPPLELRDRADSRAVLDELTRAFRFNLQALSLLTLLVGAFLIFNTVSFTVVRRRRSFGILRAIGATRSQLFRMVIVESLTLGIAGTALGIALGYALGHGLLDIVTQTIEDHYFTVAVTEIEFRSRDWVTVLITAPLLCGLAALSPAFSATRIAPREVLLRSPLESQWRQRTARGVWVAVAVASSGALMLALGNGIGLAYAGLFTVLIGAACATPAVCRGVAAIARPVCGRMLGAAGVHAARSVSASLSRTAVATSALMLAVATTVGLGTMIASFRDTVDRWLGASLRADVYVAPPASITERFRVRLAPALIERIPQLPGVEAATSYRRFEIDARVAGQPIGIARGAAVDGLERTIDSYQLIHGGSESVHARVLNGSAVLISEPFANRLGLQRGDRFELRGRDDWVAVEVGGVFFDYGSEVGYIVMAQQLFERSFPPIGISAFGLHTGSNTNPEELAQQILAASEGVQRLGVHPSRKLHAASLEVFDRTFAITAAMRLLCLAVAFLGIWSALMSLQLERRREVGVLRALGAVPRQIAVWITTQTAILGLAAGLWALPVGAALGWILVHVINRRSFGWTLLTFEVPGVVVAEALALAVLAAVLAGMQPALRFSRERPVQALRED